MAEPRFATASEIYELPEPPPIRRSWTRRMFTTLIAVVALAGFAGLVAYAYHQGREAGSNAVPPIIKAGPTPHKIKPERPGGMRVPNRDKRVYSRLDPNRKSPRVERLLPPPEKPLPRPAPNPARQAPTISTPIPPPQSVRPLAPPTTGPTALAPPPRPARPASKTNVAEPAKESKPATDAPDAATQSTGTPRQAKATLASRLAAISPAAGGRYRIQLASVRDRAAATRTWTRLRKAHTDVLGRLGLMIESRDLGPPKGVFYRVQAGPLADLRTARELCDELKKRKRGCIVVKR